MDDEQTSAFEMFNEYNKQGDQYKVYEKFLPKKVTNKVNNRKLRFIRTWIIIMMFVKIAFELAHQFRKVDELP